MPVMRRHTTIAGQADCPDGGVAVRGDRCVCQGEALGREIRQLLFRTRKGRTYRALFDIQGKTVRVLRIRGPGQQLLAPEDFDDS